MKVHGEPRVALEPKLLKSEGKASILNLRVIDSRSVKKDGQWVEKPTHITVLLFGKQAESLYPRVKRGDLLSLNGELIEREFVDKAGNKRTVHEIHADSVKVLQHSKAAPTA